MTFWKTLIAYLIGLACQVLGGIFPDYAIALATPGALLLGLANIGLFMNGSFTKHMIVFLLALACQVLAARFRMLVDVRAALTIAATALFGAADLKRIFMVITGKPVAPPTKGAQTTPAPDDSPPA